MLTDNTTHDIGPRVNGEYIIWQAEEADGWMVNVYDASTKKIERIADADGASLENPRVVLVYDAKHDNGDIETRGYDLDTGTSVALGSEAPVLPETLPDPEQTGEERALIAGVTQLKTKVEDEEDDEGLTPIPLLPDISDENGDDVVVPPYTATSSATTTVEATGTTTPSASGANELVIEALPLPDREVLVPDLIIPPFDMSLTTPDSQGEVAGTP
jgi:hypothetical protein